MSSLQRTVIVLALCIGGLCIIYFHANLWPSKKNDALEKHADTLSQLELAEIEKDKKKKLDELKKKAQEQLDDIMVVFNQI